ncbi:MAG TPA: glycosyltransferase family 4 protein [Acidobacteriaceae bacterium]|nr:glycosyltransferase family 4 protein [Acidobacteriaceae bacterium]
MSSRRSPRIFMMDLWATVPYYTAYLSKALLAEGALVTIGSISYYLDPGCFSGRGLRVSPGLFDIVGRFRLPKWPRRLLKLPEAMLNLAALTVRFTFSPRDVIHVQYLPMLKWRVPLDLWFLEYCRARGSKLVLTVHDLLPHDTGERYKTTFLKLYATVDAIICHSDSIRGRLEQEFSVPSAKISVIPHGPFFYDLPSAGTDDPLLSFDLPLGAPMVLWQGILFPYKGVDVLLNAWKYVEATHADAMLIVAGTGAPDLLEQIRAQVRELGLQRVGLHFRFISTEELVALHRAAAIVVYPYNAITTSGALATGLALGKTIVATDLPVFRELLTDRENALLVPPRDPQALGNALIELLGNPELRNELASQVRAMDFGDASWLSIAEKTLAVYAKVTAA